MQCPKKVLRSHENQDNVKFATNWSRENESKLYMQTEENKLCDHPLVLFAHLQRKSDESIKTVFFFTVWNQTVVTNTELCFRGKKYFGGGKPVKCKYLQQSCKCYIPETDFKDWIRFWYLALPDLNWSFITDLK